LAPVSDVEVEVIEGECLAYHPQHERAVYLNAGARHLSADRRSRRRRRAACCDDLVLLPGTRRPASELVLCVDSLVLIVSGALSRLIEYFEAAPGCLDLAQGPLLYDDLRTLATHFEPRWQAGIAPPHCSPEHEA